MASKSTTTKISLALGLFSLAVLAVPTGVFKPAFAIAEDIDDVEIDDVDIQALIDSASREVDEDEDEDEDEEDGLRADCPPRPGCIDLGLFCLCV